MFVNYWSHFDIFECLWIIEAILTFLNVCEVLKPFWHFVAFWSRFFNNDQKWIQITKFMHIKTTIWKSIGNQQKSTIPAESIRWDPLVRLDLVEIFRMRLLRALETQDERHFGLYKVRDQFQFTAVPVHKLVLAVLVHMIHTGSGAAPKTAILSSFWCVWLAQTVHAWGV